MGFFFLGQCLIHIAWGFAAPGALHLALLLALGLCVLRLKGALACCLGMLWQKLLAAPPVECDAWLWFLCKPQQDQDLLFRILSSTWIGELAQLLGQWLRVRSLNWDPEYGPWLLGLLTGESQSGAWYDLYQQLGLLHVLVVSGSHFSLLSSILRLLLLSPWTFLYTLKLISMRQWPLIRLLLDLSLLLLLLLFLLLVQAQAPCQRAFFMALVPCFERWLLPSSGQAERRAFLLQALLFPSSFFSLSNALSWAATACLSRGSKALGLRFSAEVKIQIVGLAFFGGFAPLGILINLLLSRLWDILIVFGVLAIVSDQDGIRIPYRKLCELVHRFLEMLADGQLLLWGGSRLVPVGENYWRWLALCSVALIVLIRLQAGALKEASGLAVSSRPP